MSRKQIKHLISVNFMGIKDKIQKFKGQRPMTKGIKNK